ncbi:thioredoxin domain-containing protein [Paenibacillus donghaensis]|uniref:thioredoxin domain-containing protein n=1 Tax=Paenibacillus donghaensis TaxID=414771 RepID=UPI001883A607|nr:thioredoxin domain-containing protein [Paenibacillus donghaensis]MBE9916885.1 thioredoxin domain-containing protein [Paenibacillus donghaensis]
MTQVIENAFLSYGKESAPVKIEVFLNLACPYCATFFQAADETLTPYIEKGQVQYVVKHYDKPREMLLYGTLANAFLDYKDPQRVYELMKDLFAKQNQWSESDSHSIKKLLTEEYGLQEQPDNIDLSLNIIAEAIKRQVKMVPTVFINGKEFQYPVEMDANELKQEVEQALA